MPAEKIRIYNDVEFLTTLRPFRNYINRESLKKTADYIQLEFEKAGYKTEEQIWNAEGFEYSNIIASYNADKSSRLIVGAHYDVCGDTPGADDNASAVAGLLESARIIAELKPEIDYRIDFVAYCLEEPPFFATENMGSYIHAKSLFDQNIDVLGMICFEMIGYFSDEPGSQTYPSPEMAEIYPDTADFIVVVGVEKYKEFNQHIYELMASANTIKTEVVNFPSPMGAAGLSDQRNYWAFNYPAAMINDTSFIRNPHYHKLSDSIETLDFDKLTAVVSAAYQAISRFKN
ncbi:MAG: M28 family peptidase [Ginsengibacter sp.]